MAQHKVFLVNMSHDPKRDMLELENLLDNGWTIIRCDATNPSGQTCDHGKLIYILKK